jgi:cell division protease FtsH
MTDLGALGVAHLLERGSGDVARQREKNRQRRLGWMAAGLLGVLFVVFGIFVPSSPYHVRWPQTCDSHVQIAQVADTSANAAPGATKPGVVHERSCKPWVPGALVSYLPQILLLGALVVVMIVPIASQARSPHTLIRPSQIPIGLDDVVGIGPVKDEVVRSLNLFLAYKTFQDQMGGTPRRGLLFEGPPGTGKTYLAKAMAHEAGVPFLFVTSTGFQSSFYGMTPRRIRAYFKQLRKAARAEGGAIGFIEEIDAIAGARHGISSMRPADRSLTAGVHGSTSVERFVPSGDAGVVNELLIQMQSFDEVTRGQKIVGALVDRINTVLPSSRQLRKPKPERPNVLLIAATNRAGDLDPALLRPGRFDRSIHFDKPGRTGRSEIIDFYLARKAHSPDLDRAERREQLALVTMGYTPVMIEHLFDEGLMWSLREGRTAMTWDDLQQAKFTNEIGLRQPVEYTVHERRVIATHEAGHCVVAHLVAHSRRLEVLSIIKRADALGLLAHSDKEERFTQGKDEMLASLQVSFGGMVAEEIFFDEVTSGPSGDLSHATQVAAAMVGAYGMAGSLVSYLPVESGGFGSANLVSKVLGSERGYKAVETLLDNAKLCVQGILHENRHLVEALRDALLERDELIGDEILAVINAAGGSSPDRRGGDTGRRSSDV